jgi:hypothetical protein
MPWPMPGFSTSFEVLRIYLKNSSQNRALLILKAFKGLRSEGTKVGRNAEKALRRSSYGQLRTVVDPP